MSSKKTYFFESQRVNSDWVWISLSGLTVLGYASVFIYYGADIHSQTKFDIKALTYVATGMLLVFGIMFFVLRNSKLEIRISEQGIEFRYPPTQNNFRLIRFNDIEKWEVSDYNPVKDNIKPGFKKSAFKKKENIVYVASGKQALKLYLKNGGKIILSTRRKDALQYAIRKLTE